MAQRDKLIDVIRSNPRNVGWLGFVRSGGKGSHRAYSRPGESLVLNFQNRNGRIPPYQARQLIRMIEKYGEEL